MKVIIIMPYGRSGVDLLQSLFDNHEEISQFPGFFAWSDFLKKVLNIKDVSLIAEKFVDDYKMFFDSRLNLKERHNQLGNNKNEHYLIDEKLFIKNFIKLSENENLNKKNIFINLHLAYSLTSGENIQKKKLIILNLHLLEFLSDFENFDYEILLTIRHPIAALSSSVKNWLSYEKGRRISPWKVYFFLERMFNIFEQIIKKKIPLHIVKLENLHTESEHTLKKLSQILKINYSTSLLSSTYHGKKWWGDALSVKYLDGLNPNFKNKVNYELFFKKDLDLLYYYLFDVFEKYNYDKNISLNNKLNFLLKYLPMKIELITLKKEIVNFNLGKVLSSFYYWVKRIKLMRNISKEINLPKDVTNL